MEKSFELFDDLINTASLRRAASLGAEERASLALLLARETSWWRPGATATMQILECNAQAPELTDQMRDADWVGLICASAPNVVSIALSLHVDRSDGPGAGEALIPLRPDRLVLFDPARVGARLLDRRTSDEPGYLVLISASNRDRSTQ